MPSWAWTLAAQVVNIAILVILIRRFLYKPVRKMLDERRAKTAAQMDDAARSTKEASDLRAKYEKLLEQARAEAADIVAQGKTKAASMVEEAVAAAAEKALAEKRRIQSDLDKELASVAAALRGKVLDASLLVASRLVDSAGLADAAAAMTRDVARRVQALSPADAEAAGDAQLAQLILSHPGDDAAVGSVREAIGSILGRKVDLEVSVDPALVLGAELRAGGLVVKSHVAARLKEARAALEADDPEAGLVFPEPAAAAPNA